MLPAWKKPLARAFPNRVKLVSVLRSNWFRVDRSIRKKRKGWREKVGGKVPFSETG